MFCPWSRPWHSKMDSLHLSLLVLGLVSVLYVQTGHASIQCYECNSEYDDECVDPFDAGKVKPTNCSSEHNFCRKIAQTVHGKYRVVRQCAITADKDTPTRCVDRTGTKLIKIRYCECEGDLCNSAISVSSMSVLLLTLGSALLALICHS